jgi:hypothetical protein
MKMAIFKVGGQKKGKNLKKIKNFFYSKSQILDVGGFAKQGIKKYSP